MGAGNVCVFGENDRLVYVDYSFYESNKDYDKRDFDMERELFEEDLYLFCERFKNRFKSFGDSSGWLEDTEKILLENNLFYIVVEDNEWSTAIKLIAKDDESLVGLQSLHAETYHNAMKEIWINLNGSVGIYAGPWTSGTITKEEWENNKKAS